MPYPKPEERQKLARNNYQHGATDAAGLCYLIAREIDRYCENVGFKFQIISDVRGAVKGALDEFEVRFAQPYEQSKLLENGEAFHFMSERIKEFKHEQKK